MQHILCEISAADTENIFYNPLPCELLPNYRRVIKRPISLTTIAAYIAATTTTTTTGTTQLVGIHNEGGSSTATTAVGDEEMLLRARQHRHLSTPYTWQAFEDDLVCMLTNCIAYHKIGSHAYVLSVNLLQKLPELFARHAAGQHVYSRVGPKKSYRAEKNRDERAANPTETSPVAASANRQNHHSRGGAAALTTTTTTTTTTVPNALSDRIKSTSSSVSVLVITDDLLKQEAIMLHFCALLGRELAGSLASVLLASPISASSVYYAHSLEYPTPLYDQQQHSHNANNTISNGFVCVNSDGAATISASAIQHSNKTKEKEAVVAAKATSSFVFSSVLNHLIPRSVEELRQHVMRHAFPSLGAFLRTVSLMLAFATACCTDEEAVEILSKFHKKIDDQCVIFADCFPSASFSATSSSTSTKEIRGKEAAEEEGRNSKNSRVAIVIDKAANKSQQISTVNVPVTAAKGTITATERNENDNYAIIQKNNPSSPHHSFSSSLMALSLQEAIASTAQALRPVCCEDIAEEAERDPLVASAVQNIIGNLVGGSAASYNAFSSTPSKQQQQQQKAESSLPKSSSSSLVDSYEQTIVNCQDAILRSSVMALIASLAVADTTGSFHRPFLFKEYLDLIKKPCDLYTMKIKAVLGHYTYPFVRHLPDTRKRNRRSVTITTTTAPQAAAETRAKHEDLSTPCASVLPPQNDDDVDNTNNNNNNNDANTAANVTTTVAAVAHGSSDADANQQTPKRSPNTIESVPHENGTGDSEKGHDDAAINADDEIHIDYTILDSVRAAIRADLDIMVDNCTYYNGPDHQLSRLVTEMRRSFASEARKCGL